MVKQYTIATLRKSNQRLLKIITPANTVFANQVNKIKTIKKKKRKSGYSQVVKKFWSRFYRLKSVKLEL